MKSSSFDASRKTSSERLREYSMATRPPAFDSHSCIEWVSPTCALGSSSLMAVRARRWLAVSPRIARFQLSRP